MSSMGASIRCSLSRDKAAVCLMLAADFDTNLETCVVCWLLEGPASGGDRLVTVIHETFAAARWLGS